MLQEIQGVQNRYEGRMEERERRVANMIGSKAREALHGQRNNMFQEHQVLLQAREREKEVFFKNQMHSELQSHVVCYRRVLHEREVQQEQVSECFENMEHKEAQLRVQLQTEKLMMTSRKESYQETSESERGWLTQRTRAGGWSST